MRLGDKTLASAGIHEARVDVSDAFKTSLWQGGSECGGRARRCCERVTFVRQRGENGSPVLNVGADVCSVTGRELKIVRADGRERRVTDGCMLCLARSEHVTSASPA